MSLSSAGLFAGIGGIERGLHAAGFSPALLCELEPSAQAVLRDRFPDVTLEADVRADWTLPKVDVLAAGFPCQDLSQAGRTAGIKGRQSGLVDHVFRRLDDPATSPRWVLLENVSFMLRLDRGAAMEYVTGELERRGFRWAYRVVDSRAFGVPQRRQRVILLASRDEDPRPVLFSQDAGQRERDPESASAFGFYWTEGLRGLGWAVDAVPTLKGGSTIGIASPPAVWRVSTGDVVTPHIEDAERLQGFPARWTECVGSDRRGLARRWKLIGNAVTVGVAEWVGSSIRGEASRAWTNGRALARGSAWPDAAWGDRSSRHAVDVSQFPMADTHAPLGDFLQRDGAPLSYRAAIGFLSRARAGSLRFRSGFLDAVEAHAARMNSHADQLSVAIG